MALISKPFTFSAGATIVASEHNSNNDTIYNSYNGNISNANIGASAGIVDTKLAQITTASKVKLSAVVIASQAQGDVIYASDATTLTRLGAGTDGQFLKTQGAGANPVWATVSAGTGTTENVIKGWINFNGTGVIAINDSYNVTSITDNATGDYTVTWDTDFANTSYAVAGMVQAGDSISTTRALYIMTTGALALGSTRIRTVLNEDSAVVTLIAIGDQ